MSVIEELSPRFEGTQQVIFLYPSWYGFPQDLEFPHES
jgi:hypothetical protein